MAEGIARDHFGNRHQVLSAGSQPSSLNPAAVAALSEIGIDISSHYSKSVSDIDLSSIDLIITLCAEEVCPIVPGKTKKLHWGLPDPAGTGTPEEVLARFRSVRDTLIQKIHSFDPELERT